MNLIFFSAVLVKKTVEKINLNFFSAVHTCTIVGFTYFNFF